VEKVTKPAKPAKMFSMELSYPYFCYDYIHKGSHYISVDLLLPTIAEIHFRPRVVSGGNALELAMIIPDFFPDSSHLMATNAGVKKFNKNTHKVTAFQDAVQAILEHYNYEHEIVGPKQFIPLSFQVEEDIVSWECQVFENIDHDFVEYLEHKQYFNVTTVELVSIVKCHAKQTPGNFCIVGSPYKDVSSDEEVKQCWCGPHAPAI